MIERKKKLRLIQLSLLIIGTLVIYFTYADKNRSAKEKIVPAATQEKIKNQLSNETRDGDVFYNIEYSGLDFSGNRYTLKSKEAFNDKSNQEIINMKTVNAVFYFKDDTILYVNSKSGTYNNKTLDMNFIDDVKAVYEGSELFADKAEFLNSKSFLIISDNVKIIDIRGTMVADKLLFDIKKQKLNIASFNDGKINANVKLK
jgi:hypothetical protein